MPEQPLILTLKLDKESQAFFDAERKLYFPPERNVLAAHLTLFHQLPDIPEIYALLADLRQLSFSLTVSGLMSLGAGTAYFLKSEELAGLHRSLFSHFKEYLIPQDKQRFRAHITIQNKVNPLKAKTLFETLQANFEVWQCQAIGLQLFRYQNGPWQLLQTFEFASKYYRG